MVDLYGIIAYLMITDYEFLCTTEPLLSKYSIKRDVYIGVSRKVISNTPRYVPQ